MKLIVKLFEKTILSHTVNTPQIEKAFANLDKIPHQDFDTLISILQGEITNAQFEDPKVGVSIDLEAYQIANLLKNVGHIGSGVPESNAVLEVIH
jgi:hypothetical protein